MAIVTRFQTNTRGALYLTGNTVGLSGNNGVPSAIGNVGGFITTSTTLATPTGWGAIVNLANNENVTLNWQTDSSSAFLTLPTGAEVLYAELVWASAIRNETLDLTAQQNTSVTLMAPDSSTTSVAPDPLTSQTVTVTGPITYMTKSNNVTDFIKQKGNGKYTVFGIPAARSGTSTCCVGWTIVIAYTLSTEPYRSLNIYTACEGITGTTSATVTVTGFSTPRIGTVPARVLIGALEGDPNGTGDQALFGPTTSSLVALSGPRNQVNNFFQSQICDNTGNLDITGTFGNLNQPLGGLASGVRQGWDITNVDASGILTNNLTSAVFRFASTGEVYSANMVSIQINVDSADLSTMSKGGDKAFAVIGDTILYTITIPNTGTTTASSITFIDTIPNGTSFVAGSVLINGVSNGSANPQIPGFALPIIAAGGTSTVSFKVTVNTLPSPNPMENKAFVSYNFLPAITATIPVFSSNESNVFKTTYLETQLTSAKTVDKSYANVGDIIEYTVILTNTGNTSATNVLFKDTIPNGTTLVPGTFKQDGTSISTSPNPPGVTLPNSVGIGGTSTIVFKVQVNTIPSPNPIPNTAAMTYSYSGSGNSIVNVTSTNQVTTQVNNANLDNIIKGTNKSFAKIGDIITYTITIPNRGSVTATNVIFKDTIPNGTSFVANSVILNGVQQNGLVVAPPTGLSVGTIAPNSSVTLSFKVTVTTIPSPNPIPNSGNVSYSYTIDPVLGTTGSGSNNTNIVTTTINSAVINSTKSVTPTNTTVGQTIFYTIVLTNTGNVTANNVTFIDTIPNDTTFVTNSLALNGATQTGQSPAPPSGFSVGSIAPNVRVTLTFNVTVNTTPNPNPIPNSSNTNYNFVVNPTNGETGTNTSLSNIVETFVNPDSNPLKIVDTDYAKPGDILTYTIQWENRLNVTATNVVFFDTIPNDTTFVTNSVTVNGVTVSGATVAPPTGLSIGTIPVGVYTTVTFKVLVNTIPNPNPIPNQAYGTYNYISDPTLGTVTTETATSNIVTTQVNYASIPSATKQVSKSFAKVGDVLTYTISFTNIGNTTATNIKLIDTIPNGTSFNVNSVFLNGANQPGAVVAPPTGLSVGSLAVNATATVVFSITVDTIPIPNPIPNTANVGYDYTIDPVVSRKDTGGTNTNTANTQVNTANLGIIGKTVDKTFANTSDTLLYTITIRNTGNVTANGVILKDTIPNNTSFINGSVLINGAGNATVPTGNILTVNMGNIAPNGVASLTFRVQITGSPNPNPIPNSANATYTYTVDPAVPNGESASGNTNIVNTQVNAASLGGITKFVDKTFASCGDIITYTISIPNTGNITANNVILSDTVPNGTVFVANSILVNGISSSATSPTSVPLGSINPGATTTVSFQVQVQC